MSKRSTKKPQPSPALLNREPTFEHLVAVCDYANALAIGLKNARNIEGEPPASLGSAAASEWLIPLHYLDCELNRAALPFAEAKVFRHNITDWPLIVRLTYGGIQEAFYSIAERLTVMEALGPPVPNGTVLRRTAGRTDAEPLPRTLWQSFRDAANDLGEILEAHRAMQKRDVEPIDDEKLEVPLCDNLTSNQSDTDEINWNELALSPPLSAKKTADAVRQPIKLTEAFLRYRRRVQPFCFIPDDNPQRGEAKYLHKMTDILPALQKWVTGRQNKSNQNG